MTWLWIFAISGLSLALLVSLGAIEQDERDNEEYKGWWREDNEDGN